MAFMNCLPLRLRISDMPVLAAVFLSFCSPLLCQAAQRGDEVIGTWRFTAVLDMSDMTSMDEKGAHQLLGHIMTIGENGTRFDRESCQPSHFEAKRVEPNLYLQREAGVDNSKLRLPNPVTVIDISCTAVYVRKPDHAVIFWNGFFFEAVRVHRKHPGPTGALRVATELGG